MPLALAADANAWLDEVKLSLSSEAVAAPYAESADNVVKSYLAIRYSDYVNLWDATVPTPAGKETPPQIVREAASLLMASYYYSKKYSEETLDDNDYASRKERQAIKILEDLRDGKSTLWDKPYGVTLQDEAGLEQDDFYPNDTAVVERQVFDENDESVSTVFESDRKFSMSQRF